MAYEQRDMSGTLFPERKDGKSERAPDYTGTVMVRGETLRVAAWVKPGRRGDFLSLAFSEPRDKQGGGRPDPDPNNGAETDEIPW